MLRNFRMLKPGTKVALGVVVAAAVAGLVVALTSGGGKAPPAPPPTERFGANVGRLFNDRTYSAAQIDGQLAALRATGATIARADALWEPTEPSPPQGGVHRYDWSFDDSIAASLATHDLRWLPIIDYSAPWAQSLPGVDHSPPSSTADYADYAAALAERYGPDGTFWRQHPSVPPQPTDAYEVWNEPDNPAFWKPSPAPAAYADLYLRARAAIHAVQPGAQVLVGGLTHPASFLPAMLAAAPALSTELDGVAIHPYGGTPQVVLDNVRAARAALTSLGLGHTPLYVTEFGWTTSPPGALDYLPEHVRPGYVETTLGDLGHLDCGLAAALLYTWVTPERDLADAQDWFGVSPPAGGASADVLAFAAGLKAAAARGATDAVCARS